MARVAARSWDAARRFAHWAAVAGRTARYLWAVRAAIPWPVKVILAVAMALKCGRTWDSRGWLVSEQAGR